VSATRGFTLAEIIVVLALLGIVAAVSVPAFTRLDAGDDASRAAADVVRVLHAARVAALERAAAVTVVVEPSSGRYWVSLDDSGSRSDSGAVALPAGARLVGAGRERFTRFLFRPNGSAVGDSLVVQGSERSAVVAVDRWTGDVHVTTP
jgi:prepilin-type N-terminal cleavage/methylation domain-containing protein